MKTTLSIEQSARLIELGVDAKLASKTIVTDEYNEEWENFQHPIYSLTDLLSILPKEIKADDSVMGADFICTLRMNWDSEWKMWHCGYTALPRPVDVGIAPELIDALYQLLIWCLEQGYLKTEKK